MPYGYGFGFGFRGASPPWPYVGLGRGGLPRCAYPGFWGAPPGWTPYATPWAPPVGQAPSPYAPYGPAPTREQELDFLKSQAEAVKAQLDEIEARVQELEKEES